MGSAANDFMAGCVGGFAQVLVGQPFDIVKVRLQTANTVQKLYNGAWDCVKKIAKHEGGFSALWRGTLPPLLGVGAAVSIQFGANEKIKELTRTFTGLSELTIGHLFACGAAAGLVNSVVTVPVEHTRIRMQLQGGSKLGVLSCVKNIFQVNGLQGLYKGGVPTLWRESISFGIYFSMYEYLIRKLSSGQARSDLSMLNVAFAGSLSGITLWFATFPIDMIKTKIQADSFHNPRYNGIFDCFMKTFKNGGMSGLYKGLSPCLMRAVPANSATFIAYETASKLLARKSENFRFF